MKKPRKSFLIQKTANSFKMEDNPYVMKLSLPNIGTVKIRGWNNKGSITKLVGFRIPDIVSSAHVK